MEDLSPVSDNKVMTTVLKVVSLLILMGILGVVILCIVRPHLLLDFLEWIEKIGYWGNLVLVVTLIGLACVPFTIGYSPLVIATGFLYGIGGGLITAVIGIILSCAVAFFVLRFLAKDWAMKQIAKRKKLQIVIAAVTHHAFKVIFLMRFTPIPYGFQNTLYAVSGVKFWIYFVATVTGMFPDAVLYVYAGSQARKLSEVVSGKSHLEEWQKWVFALQIVLIVGLFIGVFFVGKRALKKAMEEEERNAALSSSSNLNSPSSLESGIVGNDQQLNSAKFTSINNEKNSVVQRQPSFVDLEASGNESSRNSPTSRLLGNHTN